MKRVISFLIVLTFSSSQIISQISTDSLLTKILSGDDDISIILDLYRNNKDLSEDSLVKLLGISDKNYLNKDKKRKSDPDLQFRKIFFVDQLFRTKCYTHKLIEYNVVQKKDSVLQTSFLQIVKKHPDLNLLTNSSYQTTFSLLLIHSVTTLHTGFFMNNFYKYSKAFSNNFKDVDHLKHFLDIYLKFKYERQFFGTEYGKGKLTNGSFGFLPKLTEKEFQKTLLDLNIPNALY